MLSFSRFLNSSLVLCFHDLTASATLSISITFMLIMAAQVMAVVCDCVVRERVFEDRSYLVFDRRHRCEVLPSLVLDPLVAEYIALVCHI